MIAVLFLKETCCDTKQAEDGAFLLIGGIMDMSPKLMAPLKKGIDLGVGSLSVGQLWLDRLAVLLEMCQFLFEALKFLAQKQTCSAREGVHIGNGAFLLGLNGGDALVERGLIGGKGGRTGAQKSMQGVEFLQDILDKLPGKGIDDGDSDGRDGRVNISRSPSFRWNRENLVHPIRSCDALLSIEGVSPEKSANSTKI